MYGDGHPLQAPLFPSINGVTMHPTAACAPPPTAVFFPAAGPADFSIRFDHAAAAPQPIYRLVVIQ